MEKYDEEIIKNVIYTIKECLNRQDLDIGLASTLAEDLDVDSSDAICFIMELEEVYDIIIEDEIIETLTTVESIVSLIQERIK